MATISIKYFDTYEFVKKSKEFGSSEELAEYQIKQFEQAIETAVTSVKDEIKSKELATKGDVRESELRLQKEIVSARNQMILWVTGLLGAQSVFLLCILAKSFHWF